jgi:hypothetical protein
MTSLPYHAFILCISQRNVRYNKVDMFSLRFHPAWAHNPFQVLVKKYITTLLVERYEQQCGPRKYITCEQGYLMHEIG